MKNILKNYLLLRRFYTLYDQKFSNLRQLHSITFPQGLRISKNFKHWTSRSRGKQIVKRSEKV